jgi:hypothetical protein
MKLLVAILAVAWVTATGGAEAGVVRSCGTLTVGPTAIKTAAAAAGPPCMLAAFERCDAARYSLSSFGVDTIATTSFSIARRGTGCGVSVARTFEVVPQQPRQSGGGTCAAIARRGGDIVATGCRGSGLADAISLTGK